MPGTVRYPTFGCKADRYDTQVLRGALARHGSGVSGPGADLPPGIPEITPELLELVARYPRRSAPHLRMPLQSGDDRVLVARHRGADTEPAERGSGLIDVVVGTRAAAVGPAGEPKRGSHLELLGRRLETSPPAAPHRPPSQPATRRNP